MAYDAFVGSFNIDSALLATETQSVTGVGFQPKVVLFWWSGGTATIDSVAGGTINIGFGAGISSSSRFALVAVSDDAQVDSDCYRSQNNTECIRLYSDGGGTLDGIADFSSMDADGFTLTIDNQFGSDWRVSYLALGGSDLTNVYIGNDNVDTTGGNYGITGVGFQPDAMIAGHVVLNNPVQAATHTFFTLGMATGSSNQGVVFGQSLDAQATSNTSGYGYNGEILSTGTNNRQAFVSFDADGFTFNHLEGTGAHEFFFVCLKGGQYSVSDLTTRTDGNDIEENVGFEPAAVLFFSANRALSTQDAVTDHNRLSIGAGTSASNRAAQTISDEDALADTETAYTNQDDAVYAHVVDDAIEALMDIKSIDSDGFTCVMDDTETSGCWVNYLAIGADAAVGNPWYAYAQM